MSRSTARLLYWSPRIHLIPTAVIIVVVIAAWRWEWVGAGLFTLAAVFYAWTVLPRHVDWAVIMAVPLLVIAALFLANWIERPKLRAAL